MPVSLKLKSFDELYDNTSSEKVLINYQDIFKTENKERLDNIIMNNYSDDNLSLIPSCSCGELKGGSYVGDVCGSCGTTVKSSVDDNLSFLIWLEKPVQVERFISPILLAMLVNRYKLTKPTIKIIEYLIVTNYRICVKSHVKLDKLERLEFLMKKHGIQRGYNNFVKDFFKIIHFLEMEYGKNKVEDKEKFLNWLVENKNNIFSSYLPFPNKAIFAIDGNELGRFIDRQLLDPLQSIRRVTGIDLYNQRKEIKQNKVAKSLLDLALFYESYFSKSIFPKQGLIRQHISSTRSHFTARAVITSIAGPHAYDEIHLPWSAACSLLRIHLIRGLRNRGYSYKKAVNLLIGHNRIYHPEIDLIFNEIIASTKNGIRCMLNRNPSLHRGSVQAVRITKIKTDTDDNTLSMSYLIGPSFNSDYDGGIRRI